LEWRPWPPSIIVLSAVAVVLAVTWFRLFVVYLAAGGDPRRKPEEDSGSIRETPRAGA
jgi:hypothetical protein